MCPMEGCRVGLTGIQKGLQGVWHCYGCPQGWKTGYFIGGRYRRNYKEGTEEDGGVILHVELPMHGHFDPSIDMIV